MEYACGHNIDFIWLVEGRSIDHDTFCKFRTRFKGPLKELFKEVGRVAMKMGLIQLVEVAFDGTRVKANASRFHTWTAAKAEGMLLELEKQAGQMLNEADGADAADAALWGERAGRLSPELADRAKRGEKLREVLDKLHLADAARKLEGTDPNKTPAQLAPADPDARLMPNKEGGYAPNYTPTAAVDGASGFIVDCNVIDTPKENQELLGSVDRITGDFERSPAKMLADGAFGTIMNLEGMQARQVDFYTPVESPLPEPGNPALRDDPSVPVAEADWPKLPRNASKQLAKSCFAYEEKTDQYYCPMGKPMSYEYTKKQPRAAGQVVLRIYRCGQCTNCPLSAACLGRKSKHGRTVSCDGSESLRAKMLTKLKTESGRKTYHRRMYIAETPFAILKGVMGLRQFLLRGLEKVRTEWLWACTAYNLKKLTQVKTLLCASVLA